MCYLYSFYTQPVTPLPVEGQAQFLESQKAVTQGLARRLSSENPPFE